MKIKIKKYHVLAITGLIFGISLYYLIGLFFKALVDEGWLSLIYFILLILTSIWQVYFWLDYKMKSKMADEAVKETVSEMFKTNPDLYNHTSPGILRNQIKVHLQDKINDESYIIKLWNK